jgi:hypothetical protein
MICSRIATHLQRCTLANFSSHTPRAYTGKSYDELRDLEQRWVNPVFFHYYKSPFLAV